MGSARAPATILAAAGQDEPRRGHGLAKQEVAPTYSITPTPALHGRGLMRSAGAHHGPEGAFTAADRITAGLTIDEPSANFISLGSKDAG